MEKFFSWNLWYPLLLIIFEMVLVSQKKKYVENHPGLSYDNAYDFRVKNGFIIMMIIPLIFIATFRSLSWGDSYAYKDMFTTISLDFSEVSFGIENSRHPGFDVFIIFIKKYISNNYEVFFFIVATISLFCTFYTYGKYTSEIVLVAYLFFMSTDYQSWLNNGIRQYLVVSVVFVFSIYLLKGKPLYYFLFICLSFILYYFHVSVIIATPVYFAALGKPMNKKTMSIIISIVIFLVFITQFSGIIGDALSNTSYESSTGEMFSEDDDGTNILRVLFYSIPAILVIMFRNKVPSDTSKIIQFSINMSIITMMFYILSMFSSGIIFGRLPIYFSLFNYVLLPWEIKTFFKKEYRDLIYFAVIVIYSIFYFYSLYNWGI